MTPKQKAQLRRKWRRWLERIGHDLGRLLISQDIFDEIRKIVESNKSIQSPSLFHRWISDNYADRIATGIRRLSDHDKRTISLYRLIEDISAHPSAITRDYYVSGYRNKRLVEIGAADRDFDNFANKKDRQINPHILKRDMKWLKKETERITKFTNKWVAHCDIRRQKIKVPTYRDVAKSLKSVDELFCKYYLLLTRSGVTSRKPVLQYDWKEPLRHTWIEDK